MWKTAKFTAWITTCIALIAMMATPGGAGDMRPDASTTNADSIKGKPVNTTPTAAQDGMFLIYSDDTVGFATPAGAGDMTKAVYDVGDDGIADSSNAFTHETVEDVAGDMTAENTETRITVTYQDGDGTIDFVVDDMNDDVPESGDFGAGAALEADGSLSAGSVDTTTLNDTEMWEYVQDHAGGMFSGNTETRIAVTYNEDGTVDFVVDDMTGGGDSVWVAAFIDSNLYLGEPAGYVGRIFLFNADRTDSIIISVADGIITSVANQSVNVDTVHALKFYVGPETDPDSLLLTIETLEDSLTGNYYTQTYIGANYQPLEATLTDIADGTIAEDLVNTANPWADNEVANDITASNYLLLAGGEMSGNVTCAAAETFDGRDLSADGTKLDAIEAAADVTDAANVNAVETDPTVDTEAELETTWGAVNVILATEIDGTGELAAITDYETGAGALVFGTAPTFTTSITIGSATIDETELEIVDGATLTTTELNYVDGVTSAIQTQLTTNADDIDELETDTRYLFNIYGPNSLFVADSILVSIDPHTEAAITVTRIEVTCLADPDTELDFDLMWCDAFIGNANRAVIDEMNTTSGAVSITSGFDDATIAANKCIYVRFNAEPDADILQVSVRVTYTID